MIVNILGTDFEFDRFMINYVVVDGEEYTFSLSTDAWKPNHWVFSITNAERNANSGACPTIECAIQTGMQKLRDSVTKNVNELQEKLIYHQRWENQLRRDFSRHGVK